MDTGLSKRKEVEHVVKQPSTSTRGPKWAPYRFYKSDPVETNEFGLEEMKHPQDMVKSEGILIPNIVFLDFANTLSSVPHSFTRCPNLLISSKYQRPLLFCPGQFSGSTVLLYHNLPLHDIS